jgi:hypothetical protein
MLYLFIIPSIQRGIIFLAAANQTVRSLLKRQNSGKSAQILQVSGIAIHVNVDVVTLGDMKTLWNR